MSLSFRAITLAFGCLLLANSCAKTPAKKIWTEFSGDKSLAHVQALVDLGPRPPGSDAIVRARAYIEEQLESLGWNVTEQAFSDQTPRGEVKFVNLVARFGTASKPSFLLCSHYDTKIFDSFKFVGANDGGSSTGLLLELARVLALDPRLAQKIELAFFDGEEAVENFSQTDGIYGSRHFAQELGKDGSAKSFRGGILFDMVGDSSLDVTLPPNSPSKITAGIFASADALKFRNYFTYFDQDITDDHSPLNAIGIPVIDLIDFHYPPWHTAEDTMDKLSPQSLQIVGSVAAYYVSELAFK
ncbi:MAG TPA: M28 family peptidase [Chthoniobacterales bacterium]|nr:M28 family peptidase [Chthoniobacterales bacterium]